MTESEKTALLTRYSHGAISAIELRRRLGNASYGDVLIELAALGLPLPRASQAGREGRIARARELLFPKAS